MFTLWKKLMIGLLLTGSTASFGTVFTQDAVFDDAAAAAKREPASKDLSPEEQAAKITTRLETLGDDFEKKMKLIKDLKAVPSKDQIKKVCLKELMEDQEVEESKKLSYEKYLSEMFSVLVETIQDPKLISNHLEQILKQQSDEYLKSLLSKQYEDLFPAQK